MTAQPFQAFLDEHRRDVYRFVVASVGPQEADDVFQDACLAALKAWPRVTDRSNLRSWMFTIAQRKAIDEHRSRKRRPEPRERLPEVAREDFSRNGEPALWAQARQLPRKQREALLYRFAGDLAYADIATAMRSSEDAARRNVHEALKKLREALS